VDKGGDYFLTLKTNQENLHEDGKLFLEANAKAFGQVPPLYNEDVNNDHGQIEIRLYWVVSKIEWLAERDLWKGINSIGMVERERHIDDQITCET
jgi:predicted transposase YbfD/YdcC